MSLVFISNDDLIRWWPKVKDFLASGLETSEGEVNLDQLYQSIESGNTQLVVCYDQNHQLIGAMTCYFINTPNIRILHISALGGKNIIGQRHIWNSFKEECRKHQVQSIRAACKPAQARLWRKLGFKVIYQQIDVSI
ncbi:MAG: hypothetical protein HC858_01625 [Brachymonas sp.]|nr:hypothetical protein [Brachymonas sp.]